MTLSDFPIKFNDTALFKPESWEVQNTPVRILTETAAGTDRLRTIRTAKWTVSAAFDCTAVWAATFQAYSMMDSFTVSYYDPAEWGYVTRTVRMNNFSSELEMKSWKITQSTGLYRVSFELEEF